MILAEMFLNTLRTCTKSVTQLHNRTELYVAMCPMCNNTDILSLKTVGTTCCLIEILYLE